MSTENKSTYFVFYYSYYDKHLECEKFDNKDKLRDYLIEDYESSFNASSGEECLTEEDIKKLKELKIDLLIAKCVKLGKKRQKDGEGGIYKIIKGVEMK